jgi:hypothetical protein
MTKNPGMVANAKHVPRATGGSMTGPQHFSKAEELAAKAHELLGHGEGQVTAAVWAAVAQVHATLAGVALAALGPDREREAWREAAGPRV